MKRYSSIAIAFVLFPVMFVCFLLADLFGGMVDKIISWWMGE